MYYVWPGAAPTRLAVTNATSPLDPPAFSAPPLPALGFIPSVPAAPDDASLEQGKVSLTSVETVHEDTQASSAHWGCHAGASTAFILMSPSVMNNALQSVTLECQWMVVNGASCVYPRLSLLCLVLYQCFCEKGSRGAQRCSRLIIPLTKSYSLWFSRSVWKANGRLRGPCVLSIVASELFYIMKGIFHLRQLEKCSEVLLKVYPTHVNTTMIEMIRSWFYRQFCKYNDLCTTRSHISKQGWTSVTHIMIA